MQVIVVTVVLIFCLKIGKSVSMCIPYRRSWCGRSRWIVLLTSLGGGSKPISLTYYGSKDWVHFDQNRSKWTLYWSRNWIIGFRIIWTELDTWRVSYCRSNSVIYVHIYTQITNNIGGVIQWMRNTTELVSRRNCDDANLYFLRLFQLPSSARTSPWDSRQRTYQER